MKACCVVNLFLLYHCNERTQRGLIFFLLFSNKNMKIHCVNNLHLISIRWYFFNHRRVMRLKTSFAPVRFSWCSFVWFPFYIMLHHVLESKHLPKIMYSIVCLAIRYVILIYVKSGAQSAGSTPWLSTQNASNSDMKIIMG